MSIQHHPDDETLLRHAAGRLNAGLALVTAAHLHGCAQCRAREAALEAVGGALLELAEPSAMAPSAFSDVLARLDAPPPPAPVARAPRRAALGLPPDMKLPPVLAGCDIGRWLWLGRGVRYSRVRLPWAPDANVMLLRVAANCAVVRHTHAAHEMTLILHGGYSDSTGQYGPGDMAEHDETVLHQPRADEEGCICLAALEGGLRLDGWMGRVQRRLGI
jgi:putative transcriptional regulator